MPPTSSKSRSPRTQMPLTAPQSPPTPIPLLLFPQSPSSPQTPSLSLSREAAIPTATTTSRSPQTPTSAPQAPMLPSSPPRTLSPALPRLTADSSQAPPTL